MDRVTGTPDDLIPTIAQPKPCLIELQAGRTYLWCSCGRSKRQPFCDGSHKGTGFEPRRYVATADEEVLFCGCKHTRTPPFCDGAHTNLPGGSPQDDPHSEVNSKSRLVPPTGDPRTFLNGDCYVFSPSRAQMLTHGSLRYCAVIAAELGSRYQSTLLLQVRGEPSPIMTAGDSQTILFIAAGSGVVTISGRRFAVTATDGVYVRPAEGFQLTADPGSELEVFASIFPLAGLQWLETMPDNFDTSRAQRVAGVDAQQRTAMGPRYFQCLVDSRIGTDMMTQFIGHIPCSKAAPHRHLYEETIVVLSGEGYVWTDDRKTSIRAGDILFLPRKQLHSVQATSAEGLDLMGVIAPGDNPSINY